MRMNDHHVSVYVCYCGGRFGTLEEPYLSAQHTFEIPEIAVHKNRKYRKYNFQGMLCKEYYTEMLTVGACRFIRFLSMVCCMREQDIPSNLRY